MASTVGLPRAPGIPERGKYGMNVHRHVRWHTSYLVHRYKRDAADKKIGTFEKVPIFYTDAHSNAPITGTASFLILAFLCEHHDSDRGDDDAEQPHPVFFQETRFRFLNGQRLNFYRCRSRWCYYRCFLFHFRSRGGGCYGFRRSNFWLHDFGFGNFLLGLLDCMPGCNLFGSGYRGGRRLFGSNCRSGLGCLFGSHGDRRNRFSGNFFRLGCACR